MGGFYLSNRTCSQRSSSSAIAFDDESGDGKEFFFFFPDQCEKLFLDFCSCCAAACSVLRSGASQERCVLKEKGTGQRWSGEKQRAGLR